MEYITLKVSQVALDAARKHDEIADLSYNFRYFMCVHKKMVQNLKSLFLVISFLSHALMSS
jgi:hypothetical protein